MARTRSQAASSSSGHEGSTTLQEASYPHGCLVQGAAVLDRFRCMPVRGVVTSNLITARPSADLKRAPVVVVLHLPFVASDYAQQIA
jgi:hypothetical protein